MPPGEHDRFTALSELDLRIGARRIKQSITCRRSGGVREDERLRHQLRKRLDDVDVADDVIGYHRLGISEHEWTHEDRQPPRDRTLALGDAPRTGRSITRSTS